MIYYNSDIGGLLDCFTLWKGLPKKDVKFLRKMGDAKTEKGDRHGLFRELKMDKFDMGTQTESGKKDQIREGLVCYTMKFGF